jgi:GntR family transcriptional repressor for pyruvate dehydrogenase complex
MTRESEWGSGPLRQPRLAEMVADVLRRRILSGQLADGDLLPKQEQLLDEFGVSKPSIREALRILETEGLVQVRRGKLGGGVVQAPPADATAHSIELALRARGVSADEVAAALRHLEPACAGLCAARDDRAMAVVPRLRAAHAAAADAVDDVRRYTVLSRAFHAELVASCGNPTIIVLLGALERICAEDSERWADEVVERGARPGRARGPITDPEYRRGAIAAHERIVELIEAGDAGGAEQAARAHVSSRYAPPPRKRAAAPAKKKAAAKRH